MNCAAALEAELGLSQIMDVEERIAALQIAARNLQQAFPHDLKTDVVVACGPNRRVVRAVFRWPGVVIVSDGLGKVIAQSVPGKPFEFDLSLLP